MFFSHALITLTIVHLLALMLPGPDFVLIVRQSIRYGRKIALLSALGIACGLSVHVMYTVFGLGFIIKTTPWLFTVFKYIGAAYFVYLGIQLLRTPRQAQTTLTDDHTQTDTHMTATRAFVTGVMTNALNPKATIFFLAIFTTIIDSHTAFSTQLLYGVWMCIVAALWFSLVSVVFSQHKIRHAFLKKGWLLDKVVGSILIILAAELIITH